jgi:hypothetical protein
VKDLVKLWLMKKAMAMKGRKKVILLLGNTIAKQYSMKNVHLR